EWLLAAQRPLVLGCPSLGWGEGGRALATLLSVSGIPGFIMESPRALSDPALHGCGEEFRRADVVLLLAPQDYVTGFAAGESLALEGRLIQVILAAGEAGVNRAPDLTLVGAPGTVVGQLLDAYLQSSAKCGQVGTSARS